MSEMLVLTTADTPELAQKLARALVEGGDAACVSILPGVRSIYRWKGRVCDEGELLLLIKTSAERFEGLRSTIRRLHTYEVPEILGLPIDRGDSDYLAWLRRQLSDSGAADSNS
jgi:periplasmic divalent cation tolerance protein